MAIVGGSGYSNYVASQGTSVNGQTGSKQLTTRGSGFDVNNNVLQATGSQGFEFDLYTGESGTFYNPVAGQAGKDSDFAGTTTQGLRTNAGSYMDQWVQKQASSGGQAEISALQQKLYSANMLSKGYTPGVMDKATQSALYGLMQNVSAINNANVTVLSFLDQAVKNAQQTGTAPGGSYTKTSSQIDLTNPEQAKGLLYQTLAQYLGHMPNDAEVKQFTASLNAQQKAHPQTTTTTYERDPVTNFPLAKSSVTSGGYDASTAAIDYARAQPGSAEFQTATTYMDAFEQALKNR